MISAEARTSAKPIIATRDDLLRQSAMSTSARYSIFWRCAPLSPKSNNRRYGLRATAMYSPRAAIR
jgi:hypothetical protein